MENIDKLDKLELLTTVFEDINKEGRYVSFAMDGSYIKIHQTPIEDQEVDEPLLKLELVEVMGVSLKKDSNCCNQAIVGYAPNEKNQILNRIQDLLRIKQHLIDSGSHDKLITDIEDVVIEEIKSLKSLYAI